MASSLNELGRRSIKGGGRESDVTVEGGSAAAGTRWREKVRDIGTIGRKKIYVCMYVCMCICREKVCV